MNSYDYNQMNVKTTKAKQTILLINSFADDSAKIIEYLSHRLSDHTLIIPYKNEIQRQLINEYVCENELKCDKLPDLQFIQLDVTNVDSVRTFMDRLNRFVSENNIKNIDKIVTYVDELPTELNDHDYVKINNHKIDKCMFSNLYAVYYLCEELLNVYNVDRVIIVGSMSHWNGSFLTEKSSTKDNKNHKNHKNHKNIQNIQNIQDIQNKNTSLSQNIFNFHFPKIITGIYRPEVTCDRTHSSYSNAKLGLFYMAQLLSETHGITRISEDCSQSTSFTITDDGIFSNEINHLDHKYNEHGSMTYLERFVRSMIYYVTLFIGCFGLKKTEKHPWVPFTYLLSTRKNHIWSSRCYPRLTTVEPLGPTIDTGYEYVSCTKEMYGTRYLSEKIFPWLFALNHSLKYIFPEFMFISNERPSDLVHNHCLHDEYVGEMLHVANEITKLNHTSVTNVDRSLLDEYDDDSDTNDDTN
jgi:NAD(P)-dependent dehydrogenase (short-subunit alcohol dehydrogenase family)